MARQKIQSVSKVEATVDRLYEELGSRVNAVSTNSCPIDVALGFVRLCHSQSCGKCTPCRVGLGQLATLIESVLDGEADLKTIDLIEKTAESIYLSADCAIGYEAANMVLVSVRGFREDFEAHVKLTGRFPVLQDVLPMLIYLVISHLPPQADLRTQ